MNPYLIIPTTCASPNMVLECALGVIQHTTANLCVVFNANARNDRTNCRNVWATIQEHQPSAIAVFLPARAGYVHAVNAGFSVLARYGTCQYVGVLNDDVQVRTDFVTPMMQALKDGADQVGPACKYVGEDGFYGDEDDRYVYLEGWCWLSTYEMLNTAYCTPNVTNVNYPVVYDPVFSPGYCEDQDLSIRIQEAGGRVEQVTLPLKHLHSQTFGNNREPFWTQNRQLLVRRWQLGSSLTVQDA
jgi:hypothetical protein